MRKDLYNASGCKDPTAYRALRNVEDEERYKKLLSTLFYLCDLAGFRIEGRVVLRDKRTGKVWR